MRIRKPSDTWEEMRVALISPPWHLANRPSLALGALKSYLAKHGVRLDAYHLHLSIACTLGLSRYHQIAMNWRLSEALYAALVAPAEQEVLLDQAVRQLHASGQTELAQWVTPALCDELAQITRASIAELEPSRYRLVGLSVTHLQLMSSLYIARMFKNANSDVVVVFGGAGVAGEAGANLLARCPEVDLVVDGEGEEALLHLAQLQLPLDEDGLNLTPNLWFRAVTGEVRHSPQRVLERLDALPTPDFSEYFALARQLEYPPCDLVMPLEASRGCAWEHRTGDQLRGCAFCALNRQWPDYRAKPVQNVLREIEALVERHQVLELSFADAYLPDAYSKELLVALASGGADTTLFCEVRPGFDEETARLLVQAGTRMIQIGVESFSTSLLARLGKGVKAIDVINSLKLCAEYGIPCQYNLLTHIPGTTEQEIRETLAVMPLLYGLQPPNLVPLFLSRESLMYRAPTAFSILPESLDACGCTYLPSYLAHARITNDVSFSSPSQYTVDAGWSMIAEQAARWRNVYQRAATAPGIGMPLSYRIGADFITVTDFRDTAPHWLTLRGDAQTVLLACNQVVSIRQLEQRLHDLLIDDLDATLDQLEDERLIVREGERVLALPVRAKGPNGCPRGNVRC